MRHLGVILILGSSALSACASNTTPPAASSNSIASATDQPNRGPDFAPASSDGLASASADTRRANNETRPAPTLQPTSPDTTPAPLAPATGNAAAAPADNSPAEHALVPTKEADNSRINQRDRSSSALTPMDQGGSEADRKITQQIRQAVMKDDSLSFSAKNVKIITIGGKVTLRGPVKSGAERSAIEAAARRVVGAGGQVDSQLELSK